MKPLKKTKNKRNYFGKSRREKSGSSRMKWSDLVVKPVVKPSNPEPPKIWENIVNILQLKDAYSQNQVANLEFSLAFGNTSNTWPQGLVI